MLHSDFVDWMSIFWLAALIVLAMLQDQSPRSGETSNVKYQAQWQMSVGAVTVFVGVYLAPDSQADIALTHATLLIAAVVCESTTGP